MQSNDDELYQELRDVRKNDAFKNKAVNLAVSDKFKEVQVDEVAGPGGIETDLGLETIVLRVGRPVLAILYDEAVLEFREAESVVWKNRLLAVKENLLKAAKAVGRIELKNDPDFAWVGTGWLVEKDVIVTNRHVANVFSEANGQGFVFKQGIGGKTKEASIDFLEEAGREEELIFSVKCVLHIEPTGGPDMAFLKVDIDNQQHLAEPIVLAKGPAVLNTQIVVIGYPASDSRIPDHQLMLDIFGNVYDKKRLAPGQVIGSTDRELLHDCSTLGGNSGSVVLELSSGEAVGLHFAGRFLEKNFAVPAPVIAERLNQFKSGLLTRPAVSRIENPVPMKTEPIKSPSMENGNSLTFNLPLQLQVTVTLSNPSNVNMIPKPLVALPDSDGGESFITEGNPADYADRKGFEHDFLGNGHDVPLPEFKTDELKEDILTYKLDGADEKELKYRHFSVVMSRSRRQCFFSAVNIDGKTSVPMKRGPWRLDPRIDERAQIMKECYGNAPKFSRGHMTRREDPIWGTEAEAIQGNSDSMHVTNTVPQMQNINAGIWLALENYALQNARKDDMRISVITGPVFTDHDPIKFGVIIPLSFWKIIVFIHDGTKALTATGYQISQEAFLQEEEFVFGAQKTNQVAISKIEKDTKLDFGPLAGLDPLSKQAESAAEAAPTALTLLGQIRFF